MIKSHLIPFFLVCLETASPIIAGNHIFLAAEEGVISVVKAGDKMEIVSQYELGEPIMVTPALDSDTLYVRGEKNLWAFRAKD